MAEIQGVIFDCDGVLFESRRTNLAFYNEVLTQMGEPPVLPDEHDKARVCYTAASPDVFKFLVGPDRAPAALELAAQLDYRSFIPCMVPEPGMVEALERLSGELPLAIATNRGTSMPEILDHFGLAHHFSAVVTSQDVPRPKPWPDMLHLAAEKLALDPDSLLFVGDSDLDRRAAKAAGILFAAYRWEGSEGDWQIGSHRELADLLLRRVLAEEGRVKRAEG